MSRLSLFVFFMLFAVGVNAQDRTCGTDQLMEELLKDPEYIICDRSTTFIYCTAMLILLLLTNASACRVVTWHFQVFAMFIM